MSALQERLAGAAERAVRVLRRPARRTSRRQQRVLLGVAALVFAVAAIVAFTNLPDTDEAVSWAPILVGGLVGFPITTLILAYEYRASGLVLGHRIDLGRCLRITILGSAANLLPLPGSVVVRVRALAEMGSTYGQGLAASAVVGALFVGLTIAIAGIAQVFGGHPVLGVVWLLPGLAIYGVGYLLLRRHAGPRAPRVAGYITVVEGALVATGAARLFLFLLGLGFDPSLSDAVALTVAGALASAVAFFPAGLGMRELLVAGISPLVGLSAAAGLAAAVVDRLFRFVLLGLFAGVLASRPSPTPADTDVEATEAGAGPGAPPELWQP